MLLLRSSPWNGRHRPASLLLLAAVLLCVSVSARLPASSQCPLYIDCANEGRHFCRPGSSHCGPCLTPLVEDEEGRCVERKRHRQHGKVIFQNLDEEIDYLRSVIEKQQVTEIKTPKKLPQLSAALTSPTDEESSRTDASVQKQKSQDRPSDETLLLLAATTADPRPAPSAHTATSRPWATGAGGRAGPIAVPAPQNDSVIVIIIALCAVVGAVAVILATVFYVKFRKESRLAEKVDYQTFGGGAGVPAATANGTSVGDNTLAQSAQMYHYQHQKQQMISMGTHKPEQKVLDTDATSDEEEVGGDFTVYECPGLAPTGEMEVKNPLFDDSTLHHEGNHK